MIFLVSFTLFENKRKSYITTDYRADWEVDYSMRCGRIMLSTNQLNPGETCEALLYPLSSSLWENIKKDDIISCYEGPHLTGMCQIKKMFFDKT